MDKDKLTSSDIWHERFLSTWIYLAHCRCPRSCPKLHYVKNIWLIIIQGRLEERIVTAFQITIHQIGGILAVSSSRRRNAPMFEYNQTRTSLSLSWWNLQHTIASRLWRKGCILWLSQVEYVVVIYSSSVTMTSQWIFYRLMMASETNARAWRPNEVPSIRWSFRQSIQNKRERDCDREREKMRGRRVNAQQAHWPPFAYKKVPTSLSRQLRTAPAPSSSGRNICQLSQ